MKKITLIFAIFCLISILGTSFAQTTSRPYKAIQEAEAAVNRDLNKYRWFFGSLTAASLFGCVGGSVVTSLAYGYPRTPPASRFLGKHPDYVTVYTYTYLKSMKYNQFVYSGAGCILGSCIAGIIW